MEMMSVSDIRYFIAKWESEARHAAEVADHATLRLFCIRIWTAEFILGDTEESNYVSPRDRFAAQEATHAA